MFDLSYMDFVTCFNSGFRKDTSEACEVSAAPCCHSDTQDLVELDGVRRPEKVTDGYTEVGEGRRPVMTH